MAESHAYGTSLFCLSRRMFILAFCIVMTCICFVQLALWLAHSGLISAVFGTHHSTNTGCSGEHCYEVFTCEGLQGATAHLREPLVTLSGAVFYPLGISGAQHGYRTRLELLGAYLTVATLWYAGIYIYDIVFLESCGAYSLNILQTTILSPFSTVPQGQQDQIRALTTYSITSVNDITNAFPAFTWYWIEWLAWVLFLAYTASQAYLLGKLVERGPLGLGVTYGLDQWDEKLSRQALMTRNIRSQQSSAFLEDAKLGPCRDLEAPYGYPVHDLYGSLDNREMLKQSLRARVKEVIQDLEDEAADALGEKAERQADLVMDQMDLHHERLDDEDDADEVALWEETQRQAETEQMFDAEHMEAYDEDQWAQIEAENEAVQRRLS